MASDFRSGALGVVSSSPCGIYNERRDVILWCLISMRKFTWHVGTNGSCVLDTYEVTIGHLREMPIDADARAVRPYRSSDFPAWTTHYSLRKTQKSLHVLARIFMYFLNH